MKKITLFAVTVLSIVFSFSVKAEYMIHDAYIRDYFSNIIGYASKGDYVVVYGDDEIAPDRTMVCCGGVYGSVLTAHIGTSSDLDSDYDSDYEESTSYTNYHDYSVEISISNQYIYLLDNGNVIASSPCVTGNSGTYDTPTGSYSIGWKSQQTTLSGADYNVTVNYWMSFCGGIGIHDATWRDDFGGDIYTYNGSHGCVNVSYDMAQTIYSMCEIGTPVYVY